MHQRVMIAMAVANGPQLLIADEPTTALDVTIQAQVLELLADLKRESGLALIFITHSSPVVAEIADRVVVMYAGEIVEEGMVADVFAHPLHPYTRRLARKRALRRRATAAWNSRHRAATARIAAGLPLRSALHAAARCLRRSSAPVDDSGGGTPHPLHPLGRAMTAAGTTTSAEAPGTPLVEARGLTCHFSHGRLVSSAAPRCKPSPRST